MKDKEKQKENEKLLLNRLNDLEKKIKNFLNLKLNLNISGKEKILDLSNKNITDNELILLSGVNFDNIEKLCLSHNHISDINNLKDFNLQKIKYLDLSFNKINSQKRKKKIEILFNLLHNIDGGYNNKDNFSLEELINIEQNRNLNELKIFKNNISINLDNNNLIQKDINEIKNKIIINYYENSFSLNNNMDDPNKILLNKINKLEKKILEYFNCILNVNLSGNEIKIDLNNKNIGNIELNLLTEVEFNNLEEINLSHNNISDIEPLKKFKNLKNIDLSFNKINDIKALKKISENNNKIEKINLNNNLIKNIDILKENIFPYIIEINLDNNNIIQKDLEEIKMIILNKSFMDNKLNKITILYKIKNKFKKLKLFGDIFIMNNKDNCKIIFNGKEQEIDENIYFENEKLLQIELKEIKKITNMSCMFSCCLSLFSLPDISYWDTSNVIDMSDIFYNCSSLAELPDISKWNLKSLTNISHIFSGCSTLSSLPDISIWDTTNIINMSGMFSGCSILSSLPDISKWNINNTTNINSLFLGCSKLSSLPDISKWNTNNVIDINHIFSGCSSLSSLPDISKWNTNNITNMRSIFSECTSLLSLPDISKWKTNKLEDISHMFSNCSSLSSLPDISKWDTNKITNISYMFYRCTSLLSLPDISKWSINNAINMSDMFFQCNKIKIPSKFIHN